MDPIRMSLHVGFGTYTAACGGSHKSDITTHAMLRRALQLLHPQSLSAADASITPVDFHRSSTWVTACFSRVHVLTPMRSLPTVSGDREFSGFLFITSPSDPSPIALAATSETKDALNAVVAEFYPDLKWRIYTVRGRLKLISALCICAEQTFSEASIKTREEVPNAFATALRAYVGSPTQAAVNKEIQELPRWMVHLTPMRGILKRSLPGRVVRIILSHPLRLNTVIDGSNRPPMLP
ncbi:hypothetical protein C8J57DRAFT_1511453 [Mycena rebaudengoi]|nr:hypothetical protein C8J57DRAFT_1511453 [Mycena rebaudengoi]